MTEITALDEYRARGTDIKQLLMELARQLEAHEQKFRAKPKDWGFPGDLGHVREELENLTLFLGSGDQSALEVAE